MHNVCFENVVRLVISRIYAHKKVQSACENRIGINRSIEMALELGIFGNLMRIPKLVPKYLKARV